MHKFIRHAPWMPVAAAALLAISPSVWAQAPDCAALAAKA